MAKPTMTGDIVGCPHCEGILRIQRLDNGILSSTATPPVEQDAIGSFITCPHCSQRVAVDVAEDGRFEISLVQPKPPPQV